MPDWSSLSDELRKLGMQLGKEQPIPQPAKKTSQKIENLVTGREHETIFGKVFSANSTYAADYFHGNAPIQPSTSHQILSEWAQALEIADEDVSSLIFLDTETTGLSGGTGTMAFMIGAARFVGKQFLVEQFFLRSPSEEKAQLAALARFVDGASAIVSYNGKSFDLPIINTRYVLNRLSNPFIDFAHFDLLHIARRVWRRRLKQCNLGVIEKEILGFYRTGEDIPGYLVPEFYRNYLLHGDGSQIAGIFYHNKIDVVSLAALFSTLAAILEDPSLERLPNAQDRISLGSVLENLNRQETAEQMYSADEIAMLEVNEQILALHARARIHKRISAFEKAIPLLQEALDLGSFQAGIELAILYEHKLRDPVTALAYTETCLAKIGEHEDQLLWLDLQTKLKHRRSRLQKKINDSKTLSTRKE